MACTGKQKSTLRALGQKRDVDVTIGKAGLTEAVIKEMSGALLRKELIKIRLPALESAEKNDFAGKIAEACGAEMVGAIGRTVLFYRPNENLEPSSRIAFDE